MPATGDDRRGHDELALRNDRYGFGSFAFSA
jgi:hypothetical protein